MRFVFCLGFLVLVACRHPSAKSGDDLARSDLAPADDLAAAPDLFGAVPIAGEVWSAPCQPVADVTVRPLGATTGVVTDGAGAFSLPAVVPGTVLELTSSAYAPTLTTARAEPILVPLVDNKTVAAAYLFAKVAMPDGTGTVAIGLGDAHRLPIGGATATLTPVAGGAALDGRYVALVGKTLAFDGPSTDAAFGAVVFLAVPEGQYALKVTSASATFADATVTVKAGYVTAEVLAAATGSGTPLLFEGGVMTNPKAPFSGAADQPIPGATVTLTGDHHTVMTTSDAAGAYSLMADFAYEPVDLTAAADGWTTQRLERYCLVPWSWRTPTFTLEQPRFAYSEMATAFGGKPPVAGTGAITVIIPIDPDLAPPGIVVTIDPPVAVTDYGTGSLTFPDDCRVRIGCSDDNPCPSGSRCEGNECLHGAAPDCQHCAADFACPTGYIEQFDSDSQCFCVQELASCLTDSCAGNGEVCWSRPPYSNESGLHDVCLPWNHPLDHADAWARFANVPPGIYTLRGTSTDPGFFFLPTQVRIDGASHLYAHVALLWGTK